MNPQIETRLEVIHFQDSVLEVYLDSENLRVIELYHRSGDRIDRIVHSAQSYLQRYANTPSGRKVLQALTDVPSGPVLAN